MAESGWQIMRALLVSSFWCVARSITASVICHPLSAIRYPLSAICSSAIRNLKIFELAPKPYRLLGSKIAIQRF